ncbi:MAG TPA: DnaB-like helicase C-terminal domain-containing protein [Patescibacteria group bacterium]|nr:DnaB-like helicase C-terminal domain-containing protein [Patescibacteria group bacterium]
MTDISSQANRILEESQEIRQKKYELDKNRIKNDYEDMVQRQQEAEVNKNIVLDKMSSDRIERIKKENREYLEHAKNSKCFINDSFNGKVPFFGKNIILAAAKTGQGKTTIGKNIAFHTLSQGGKVLYISNEENPSDVYNGVTCICKKWSYINHESFSPAQLDEFDRMIGVLSNRMVVVDDNYNGNYGQTTTLEGVKSILMNLQKSQAQYDVIIIDYYQNIGRSSDRPSMSPWQVQEEFAKFLDTFKNNYLAPIIVLSQLKEGKDLEFKEAIEGRKMILNISTCAMKVVAERDYMRTSFHIEKSRFTSAVGDTIYVGFDRGRYVEYTDIFKNNAELEAVRKISNNTLSRVFGGNDGNK